jgi:hypothetical protein
MPKSHSGGRHNAPRLNATNLAGITTLMNVQHVKPGINLDDIEKSIMGKKNQVSTTKKAENDPVRIYAAELNQLANELGIDLHEDVESVVSLRSTTMRERPRTAEPKFSEMRTVEPRTSESRFTEQRSDKPRNTTSMSTAFATDHDYGDSDGDDSGGDDDEDDVECDCDDDCPEDCECECHEECDCDDDCPEDCDCDCHFETETGEGSAADDILSQFRDEIGISDDRARHQRRNRINGELSVPNVDRYNGGSSQQDRRQHIDSIVNNIRHETHTSFSGDRERIYDIKASKLEQIGQLSMTLEEEGIDCSSVNKPSMESSMEDIDSVLNILRLKNDRNRYSSIAEEVILGLAEGIETVFDGSRTVPLVGWRPDYTGYHNTVSIKLHRMRSDTSQIVGDIIKKYDIGPTTRILLELFPSFLLYSRHQKKQRSLPGLSSDPRIGDVGMAMSSIRASDERRSLDDVRNL